MRGIICRGDLCLIPSFRFLFWLGAGMLILAVEEACLSLSKGPFAILLISWTSVMLLPVILTDGAPTYTRIFGAIPALAAIAALSFAIPGSMCSTNSGAWRVMAH
ncbi:MAG: hypothetical protein M5U34_42935 [Chloroflexi bacterium]|nr:hypothetical protein [Chloroflexota bacterium]